MNLETALVKLRPGSSWSLQTSKYEDVVWLDENTEKPSKEEVEEKIHELQLAEPLRLLRIERDKKLQESDWRTNNDYPYDDADTWATYRVALRNLPAEIAAGNVAAPVLQNGTLLFDWPQVPNA